MTGMKHKKTYNDELIKRLETYANDRTIDMNEFSPYHMRLTDGYTIIDMWTTYKYYVLKTDYSSMTDKGIIERGGEDGYLPRKKLERFLDNLFYAPDMQEEGNLL